MSQLQQSSTQTLKLIWLSLIGSLIVYGPVLEYVILPSSSNQEIPPLDALKYTLSGVAIITYFTGIILPKFLFRKLQASVNKKFPGTPIDAVSLRDLIPLFITPFVLRLALFEAGALFGFVLAFTFRDIRFYLPFMGISILAFILNYPSDQKIRESLKK